MAPYYGQKKRKEKKETHFTFRNHPVFVMLTVRVFTVNDSKISPMQIKVTNTHIVKLFCNQLKHHPAVIFLRSMQIGLQC